MEKIMNFVKLHGISIVAALALVVGTVSASATCWVMGYQPECPKELLK